MPQQIFAEEQTGKFLKRETWRFGFFAMRPKKSAGIFAYPR